MIRRCGIPVLLAACGSFGEDTSPPSDAGTATVDATVDATVAIDGATPSPSFCASLSPPAFLCDEFANGTIGTEWRFEAIGSASTAIVAAGPSPPSLRMRLSNGARCGGDQGFLIATRSLAAWTGGVRMRAKLNIDQPSGTVQTEAQNGGPQVDLAGAGGLCTFYVGWHDGIPRLKVDRALAGQPRDAVFRSYPLLDAAVAFGRWVDVQIDVSGSLTGTKLTWRVDAGPVGSGAIPECIWSKPNRLQIIQNCSTAAFELGVDDVAFSMLP